MILLFLKFWHTYPFKFLLKSYLDEPSRINYSSDPVLLPSAVILLSAIDKFSYSIQRNRDNRLICYAERQLYLSSYAAKRAVIEAPLLLKGLSALTVRFTFPFFLENNKCQ